MKDCDAYVPVNYISPEACAFLVAAEAAFASRAEALDSDQMEHDSNGRGPSQSALDCLSQKHGSAQEILNHHLQVIIFCLF